MRSETIKDLEIESVIKDIQRYALSIDGMNALKEKPFVSDKNEIETTQGIIKDLTLIPLYNEVEVSSFPDIEIIITHLTHLPYSLNGEELFLLKEYLQSAISLIHYTKASKRGDGERDNRPLSASLIEELEPSLHSLYREIEATLETPGTVKLSHPSIARLVKKLEQQRSTRSSYSSSFLAEHKEIASSNIPSYKDNRVVLPIRNDRRSEIQGFVHSASNSQNTLFMESYPLVELNNAVVIITQEIEIEIAKIIASLSKQALLCLNELTLLRESIAYVDSLYALSRYKEMTKQTFPSINEEREIHLIESRHPLLKETCVPISVHIADPVRSLVISGPNAGGKTVTIKTIALLAYMNQTFFMIPAEEGSSLPLFSSIFTDIGDEQSIEKSLSTFSSHMKRISEILKEVNSSSLVILDELGSGTDPIEGAALAKAILQYLLDKGGITCITSHHSLLKQAAYAHPNMLNASMEFNEVTNMPTFRVISGLPGDSHALHTAKQMGLPKEVIAQAEGHIGSDNIMMSNIIRGLEEKEREVEQLKHSIKKREKSLNEQIKKEDLRTLTLNQQEKLLKEGQLVTLNRFISDKKSELENLVAFLREGEITKEKVRKMKEYQSSLDEKVRQTKDSIEVLDKKINTRRKKESHEPIQLEVGTEVYATERKREGVIVRIEKNDRYQVSIGGVKFTFNKDELSPIRKKTPIKPTISYSATISDVKMSIDVRGKTLN
ncbi:MAG: endonuclease MutS2, partial [Spirochaetia bacterium]|nr:endonuclease MutS2 [Spirochaetia bacterium]